tara:strand:- start:196 stop:489 length:294 start_codon:yes stop_codon:yes gene_type:complete
MTLPKPKKIEVERYIGGLSEFKKIDNPIKLSANESALGASPKAIKALTHDMDKVFKYPESDSNSLRDTISKNLTLIHEELFVEQDQTKYLTLFAKYF